MSVCYYVVCEKPTVNLIEFDDYDRHALRLTNIEPCQPDLKVISDKYEDANYFIINNALSYERWNTNYWY